MVGYFSTEVWDFGTILPKNKEKIKVFMGTIIFSLIEK